MRWNITWLNKTTPWHQRQDGTIRDHLPWNNLKILPSENPPLRLEDILWNIFFTAQIHTMTRSDMPPVVWIKSIISSSFRWFFCISMVHLWSMIAVTQCWPSLRTTLAGDTLSPYSRMCLICTRGHFPSVRREERVEVGWSSHDDNTGVSSPRPLLPCAT